MIPVLKRDIIIVSLEEILQGKLKHNRRKKNINIKMANAVPESAHDCDETFGKEGLTRAVCKQECVQKHHICLVCY